MGDEVKRALACLAMLACSAAHAEPLTGNQYLALYEEDRPAASAYMAGFMDGGAAADAVNGLRPNTMTLRGCPPPGATILQYVDVAVKELRDAPEYRHIPAVSIFIVTFNKTWPCPVKKKSGAQKRL